MINPSFAELSTPCASPEVDLDTFFDVSLDLLVIRDLDGRVVRASPSWQKTKQVRTVISAQPTLPPRRQMATHC